MAGLTSIGGLVSGLDTSSIIDQLMAIEGNKQTLLRSKLAAVNNTKSSLQTVNVQLAALATAAKSLSGAAGWTTRAVTSSSENVSASATTAAVPGSYSFTVGSTAASHRLVFTATAAATDQVVANGGTLSFTDSAGATTAIPVADGTLSGVVRAINDSGAKVTASVVTLSNGQHRLSVASAATGAASAFTLTAGDGTAILGGAEDPAAGGRGTLGRDASITIDGDTISSSTNTFAGALNGVTLTLSPKAASGDVVSLDVRTDSKAISTSVGKLVEQVNSIIAEISLKSAYNAETKKGSALTGSPEVRELRQQLLSTVTSSVNGVSLSTVGVQVTREGKLTFDAAVFDKAFAADPAAVQAAFTATSTVGSESVPVGLAARLEQIAGRASNPQTGTLVTSMKGIDATAKDLTSNIGVWDRRLEVRRLALERQYTAMESALSRLQNQSTWLSGQISSLNAGSSS